MKKVSFGLIGVSILLAGVFTLFPNNTNANSDDPEYVEAVSRMFENNLTRFGDPIKFAPNNALTREQAAKFFTEFALQTTEAEEKVESSSCNFTDLGRADSTLQEHIFASCILGLFRGSNGNFKPTTALTKAEALTVLIRAIEGNQPENTSPRRNGYHKRARHLGLTKEDDVRALDKPVSRYEIALILYRAQKRNEVKTNPLPPAEEQAQIEELKQILLELGLMTN